MAPLRSALAVACAGLVLLSACSAAPAASPSAEATPQGGRSQQARMNGTYGLIAAIDGTTLQVQGQSGQTAVTYTDATGFTQQKAGGTADLVAGACVTVRGDEPADASGSVTARTIAVTPAEDGQCSGFGGSGGGQGGMPSGEPPAGMGGGARPSGMPDPGQGRPEGGRPSGAPTAFPGGTPGPDGQRGGGGMVMGLVESVGAGTLTVTNTVPGQDSATTTVTFDDSVTVTATVAASASALAVGRCAFASGKPDDTGAVAATAIRVSDAVDGACTLR